jgi:hypothetical protein
MKKNTGMRLFCLVSSSCLAFLAWAGIAGADVSFTLNTTLNNPASQADARFGYSVAGVGDVNNDGVPDCLVGAPLQDIEGQPEDFSNAGQAFVFTGSNGALLATINNPDLKKAANFGRAVAGVGDVNGDERPDFLVGAPGDVMAVVKGKGKKKGTEGKAFVFAVINSQPDQLMTLDTSTQKDARFGYSVAGVGDVNNDGVPDFLVGTPWEKIKNRVYQGEAFVFSGAGEKQPILTLNNPDDFQAVAYFGQAVAGAGDINGDGVPDLLVGAPFQDVEGNSDQGRVFIFSGSDGILLKTLDNPVPQAGAYFGQAVAGAGDINGDNVPDLLVGAPFQDVEGNSDQGQVFVFSGPDGILLKTLDNPVAQGNAWFGSSVAVLRDVNGDDVPDFLVGASAQDVEDNSDQGQAFVFSGSDGILLETLNNPNPQASAYFGLSVAVLGDVNDDNVPDFLVGAPGQDVGSNSDQGQAFIFTSSD